MRTPNTPPRTASRAVAALLVATGVGAGVFLASYRPPVVAPPVGGLTASDVERARSELSGATTMFGILSGAVTSASSGITAVTGGASGVFDAVATARRGAQTAAAALAQAPSPAAAAGQVGTALDDLTRALDGATALADTAARVEQLVAPLASIARQAQDGGASAARLESLRASARSLRAGLGDLGALRTRLAQLRTSLTATGAGVDAALGDARRAADELARGLTTVESARADTLTAVRGVDDGMRQLTDVLAGIDTRLRGAQDALVEPDEPPPAPGADAATAAGRGVAAGSVAGLATSGLLGVFRRRRRPVPQTADASTDS